MGIRCWPWKKKSSDKTATAADSTTVPADLASSLVDQRAMGKRCWPWKKKSFDKTATAADSTTVPADSASSLVDQKAMGIRCWAWKKKSSNKTATAADSTTVPTDSASSLVAQYQKENKLLTDRLMAMEEETKMLKEALANCNNELQTSRSIYARTACKLQSLEAQLVCLGEHNSSPKPLYGSMLSQNASIPPSSTSLSEDGNDGAVDTPDISIKLESENECASHNEEEPNPMAKQESSGGEGQALDTQPDANQPPLMKLQYVISLILESMSKEADKFRLLEDAKHMLQDISNNLYYQPSNANVETSQKLDIIYDHPSSNDNTDAQTEMTNKENLVKQYAIVAEEAVSGWEKAVAEVAALKTLLESVTLMKFTAEGRASHLDGALKECTRQITTLKEGYEQKLYKSAAENAALSRSLQERSLQVEAECQRLRGLVRKKLPAPAALAQMKLEVESLGRDSGKTRLSRSPIKPSTPHMSTFPGFSLDGIQKYLKEIQQWLTAQ